MYYKILNQEEIHNGLAYHDGLNTDPLPFNPSGDCEPGGIYFASAEQISRYLDYGPWIRTVEPVGEIYNEEGKSKAHEVILGPRQRIEDVILDICQDYTALVSREWARGSS